MMELKLLQVLSDARADSVTVTPRHIFSVILNLTKGGHLQHIGQVSDNAIATYCGI